jgi:hypothetical protein
MLNPILIGSAALATGINTMETAMPIDTAIALNDVRKNFFRLLFIVSPPKSFGYAQNELNCPFRAASRRHSSSSQNTEQPLWFVNCKQTRIKIQSGNSRFRQYPIQVSASCFSFPFKAA